MKFIDKYLLASYAVGAMASVQMCMEPLKGPDDLVTDRLGTSLFIIGTAPLTAPFLFYNVLTSLEKKIRGLKD